MLQADRTSNHVQVAPQHISMPSVHAQCSQNLTPSHLQALKVLERSAPKTKFSGRNNEMNFERFMASMERAMDAEGVTDALRVEHIDNWFSGQALRIVQSKKNNDVFVDAATTLENIKRVLKKKYFHFRAEEQFWILIMWQKV
jgi:hypothetical protein